MRLLAALTVMAALLSGCRGGKEPEQTLEPPPCRMGHGRPINEATLKAVLGRQGIHLRRDDRCATFRNPNTQRLDPSAPLATLRNSAEDYDRVIASQGDIFCDLERQNIFGPKLERIKYEGDRETHLRTLNILCTIYPESPEQIDALADALSQLPGL